MSLTLEYLRRNPEAFLRQHPLQISGASEGDVGPHVYYWSDLGGKMQIATGKCPATGYQFSAYTVPIDNPDNVTLRSVPASNPMVNILVTTLLTGCSFIWDRSGDSLRLGHVMPPPKGHGAALQKSLKADHKNIYGRKNYGDGRTSSVIGFYVDGGWSIFVQERSGFTIHRVKKIVK